VYKYIAVRVCHVLDVSIPAGPTVHLTMRSLFNAAFAYLDGLREGPTPYERRLHARRVAATTACLADLWRMQNFMAIGEDELKPPLTAEHAGDILFRLEREVYGEARTRPLREAVVRVGQPWDLAASLSTYRADRKATLASCTERVERELRDLVVSFRSQGESRGIQAYPTSAVAR